MNGQYTSNGSMLDGSGDWYKFMGCKVHITKDNDLWHLSISRTDRLPNYEELKSARYQYLPDDIYVAQIFPPKKDFVNFHQFCLHLWQLAPSEIQEGYQKLTKKEGL